jgi:hypothetical protein
MNNNLKILILYFLFSVLFLGISFFIAYISWWRIDQGTSEFFIIVFSVMLCWIGVGYLSTLISSKIIFNNLKEIGFISPFTLVFNNFFYEKKGLLISKRIKKLFSSFAFPLLFFFIFLFYKIVNFVERTDLTYYRIERIVRIDNISYYKGSKRAHVNLEYDKNKISKVIYLKDTLKNVGDYETIVFSSRNPYIMKSKIEYEENIK